MSNRGWLVTGPHSSRSTVIAESASYIPLFWLSFLSPADIGNAEPAGQFELDRKQAIELSAARLPFFSSLFPEAQSFSAVADSLTQKVAARRSKTIGIGLADLVDGGADPAMPGIEAVVRAIDRRDADYSLTVSARAVANPFIPGTTVRREERLFRTTQEFLLQVCLLGPDVLTSGSEGYIRETIVGHVRP